ncbi:MAG: hypothetical protein NTU61_02840 [Candidatus Altiarchaeota archaeon]|nr:hypothetical protein [Candidatus Altiarchaeota archaeon]
MKFKPFFPGFKTSILIGLVVVILVYSLLYTQIVHIDCGSMYSSVHGSIVPQLAGFEVSPEGDIDLVFTSSVKQFIHVNKIQLISKYETTNFLISSNGMQECTNYDDLTVSYGENFNVKARKCIPPKAVPIEVSIQIDYVNLESNTTQVDHITITKNDC